MPNQYLSVKETSEILNRSEQYVRQLLRYGEISGERISSRWIVASESVHEYRCHEEDANIGIPDHGRRSFIERRQKAGGRRQKDQLQGDSNPPATVDRQIERSSHASEETSEDVTSAFGGGFEPKSKKGEGRSKPSALCLTTSAFQGGSLGKPDLKALSFFSGCMGLDLGLEKEGIKVLLTCEIDPAARKTIEMNRPDMALIGDIRDYSATEIREKAGLSSTDEIDVIVGGPPCQAFSSAGKRKGFNDERGNVFLTFIDLITELKPRFAVIENVRGLLSAPLKHRPHEMRGKHFPPLSQDEQRGGALLFITRKLKKAGYSISFNLYNAANFGSPQKRERVVIACSRDGKKLPYLTPTHSEKSLYGLPTWRTLQEALEGLPRDSHHFVKFPEKRLKYYRLLKPGQYWRDLPEELQKEALGASYHAGGGKTGFYRRLAWDQPAPTLVTHPAMPATDLAHPEEDRPLSIEEYKRIQEFPDDWMIAGTLLAQYRQVGNAVPCSLGRAIARMLLTQRTAQAAGETPADVSSLKDEIPIVYPEFPYSRYHKTDDVSWMADTLGYLEESPEKQLSLNLV